MLRLIINAVYECSAMLQIPSNAKQRLHNNGAMLLLLPPSTQRKLTRDYSCVKMYLEETECSKLVFYIWYLINTQKCTLNKIARILTNTGAGHTLSTQFIPNLRQI